MLNKLARFYALQVEMGKMDIEDVPAKVRELTKEQVKKDREG